MDFSQYIKSYPDFPKPGVLFWDFVPLLSDPTAFKATVLTIKEQFCHKNITHILAIEAKGFTVGAALAYEMALPLILARKPGLIPEQTTQASFIKEYGEATYELKVNTVSPGDNVLIIYDILACSGATEAAIALVTSQGASVAGCAYVVELEYLAGRQALKEYDLFSLVKIKSGLRSS